MKNSSNKENVNKDMKNCGNLQNYQGKKDKPNSKTQNK